jgi:hypothetical protein
MGSVIVVPTGSGQHHAARADAVDLRQQLITTSR